MKFFKKALKALLCTSLVVSLGISATACNTDDGGSGDGGDGSQEGPGYIDTPIFTPPDDGSEGIDWSKYWDGVSNVGSSADNFSFTKSIDIGTVDVGDISGGNTSGEAVEVFSVRFDGNSGEGAETQTVNSGSYAIKPTTPQRSGYMFVNWLDGTSVYDFSKPVTKDLTLKADWAAVDSKIKSVMANTEGLTVTWTDSNPAGATVQYKSSTSSSWKTVDAPLIRSAESSTARVDILGLPAGSYNVKITPSSGSAIELPQPVTVEAYDRSGYAHFNYTDGVGAYKDSGEIKDNTLVIYVTEENKNSVHTGYVNGQEVEIPLWNNNVGIGWILNNRAYDSDTSRANYGIQKLSFTYGAVAIRFIGTVNAENPNDGKVSLINGLTEYNSTGNGGSTGDNGRMARITNAKNLTIEGVGDDACLYGWGIHFIANDAAKKYQDAGTSFEVRNLTFNHYPEDAIGMEGQQGTGTTAGGANAETNDLISPVERCWIHHNVFYPGYAKTPAESDKAEGDGSCDFKRGQYYTLSYNYFEYCHKTNLIGSADASLTYNVTMHHNWWNNCGSRQPLARRANIHFYNNYISGDPNDANASLSYITSLRANCLVFSEANYYDGCKNVTQLKNGAGAAWNNVYYACTDENKFTELTSRTQTIANSCKFIYRNIDYSQFYVNPDQFYYDATNQTSKCALDDAVTARARVMMYAGTTGFGQANTAMNTHTPATSVQTSGDTTTIQIPTTKNDTEVNGVMFRGLTGASSGTVKGKGQIVTFNLSAEAAFTLTATASSTDNYPYIVSSNGTVYASKVNGTVTVVLPKGTYFIGTGNKSKEATISAISFADTAASSAARVENAQQALAAIPSTVSLNSETVIKEAQLAYSALLSTERDQISSDVYSRYLKAVKAYDDLKVEYVIARIDYIGNVTADSYNLINAAQTAFSSLDSEHQNKVTNYSVLSAAWATYSNFAAQNVINKILDLPDLTQATVKTSATLNKLYDWFNAVNNAFDELSVNDAGDGQRGTVLAHNGGATYQYLLDGLDELKNIENFLNFKDLLAEASVDNASTDGAALVSLYNGFSEAQIAKLSAAEKTKFDEIKAAYDEFMAQAVKAVYNSSTQKLENENGGQTFTLTGGNAKTYKTTDSTSKWIIINGESYLQAFEFNSGSDIRFTLPEGTTKTLRIYTSSGTVGKEVVLNGTKYASKLVEDANNRYGLIEIEVTGTGSEIVITRSNTPVIFVLELV